MDILGVDIPTWVVWANVLLVLLYVHGTWTFSTFTQMGLPGPKPLPYLGNMLSLVSAGCRKFNHEIGRKYGGIAGYYEGRQPVLLISDPQPLKQILVKDFHNYVNHRSNDSLGFPFDKMLFGLKDGHWKRVRNLMTPVFTTGKLKQMMCQMNQCAQWVVEFLKEQTEKEGKIDFVRCGKAYSLDVIAATVFGMETNSTKNQNDKFVEHVQNISKPRIWLLLNMLLFPRVSETIRQMFGISAVPKESINFFLDIIKQLLTDTTHLSSFTRQKNFLRMLKEAKLDTGLDNPDTSGDNFRRKDDESFNNASVLTTDEVVAQAFIILLAGTEAVGSAATFFCYSMATNQDVQEKLMAEIDEVVGDQEMVTVELIDALPYLDQCMSECLRMYNPSLILDRVANDDVEIMGYKFRKGTFINIAVDVIHHDPKFWPEPERFDPERFSPENKSNIVPMTYLPFGSGPRHCLGIRMALIELKILVVRIFQSFRFRTCDNTLDPMVYGRAILLQPGDKVWLQAERRDK